MQRYTAGYEFLDHEKLKELAELRRQGEFDKVERRIKYAIPSPAVADELRKVKSFRARIAKKEGDWKAIVTHLEAYLTYANRVRPYCLQTVSAPPPDLTDAEKRMLEEARRKIAAD